MTPTLQAFVAVSGALFSIGLLAALSRRHAIFILIGIELMLAAANLNFIAFWRFAPQLFHCDLRCRSRGWLGDGHRRLSPLSHHECRSTQSAQRMNAELVLLLVIVLVIVS